MAITRTILCPTCNTEVREMRANDDYDPICSLCRLLATDKKRAVWLAARAGLSVDERLRLIEEYIYDYKPPRDIMGVRF